MPYVLSTALVLILGEHRQTHIRLRDLCTPPLTPTPHQSHNSVSFSWMCGSVTEERRVHGWRSGSATSGCVGVAWQRLPRRLVRFVCGLVFGL